MEYTTFFWRISMEDKEKFKSKKWPEDVGATLICYEETTKEEKEKNKKEFDEILKERGIK